MRIMLACAYGMSTNMLVERMKKASADKGYEIWAASKNDVKEQLGNFDVLLLGPQIAFELEELTQLVGGATPVALIKGADYGLMNGENVVKFAEELVKEYNK